MTGEWGRGRHCYAYSSVRRYIQHLMVWPAYCWFLVPRLLRSVHFYLPMGSFVFFQFHFSRLKEVSPGPKDDSGALPSRFKLLCNTAKDRMVCCGPFWAAAVAFLQIFTRDTVFPVGFVVRTLEGVKMPAIPPFPLTYLLVFTAGHQHSRLLSPPSLQIWSQLTVL